MWWTYFWIISLFDIVMILLNFVWPNLTAVWWAALVASWIIGGFAYKANKYSEPLPDDAKNHFPRQVNEDTN